MPNPPDRYGYIDTSNLTTAEFVSQLSTDWSNGYQFGWAIGAWVAMNGYETLTGTASFSVIDSSAYSTPAEWANALSSAYADGYTEEIGVVGTWTVLAQYGS